MRWLAVIAVLGGCGSWREYERAKVPADPRMGPTEPAGAASELALTVRNDGPGPAFRLVGSTKSDHPKLHGLRFSFGKLAPGATMTKKVAVSIPREDLASEVAVLVAFTEAGGNQPSNYTKRFQIQLAPRPRLEVSCQIAEGAETVDGQLMAEAGGQLVVRCGVDNRGDAPANDTELSASLDGAAKPSGRRTIAPGAHADLEALLQVPASFEVGSAHSIGLTISERNFGDRIERPPIAFTISRQAICTGKITRPQYDAKVAKLKENLRSGIINQKEFDRYQGQLLGCLE